MGDTLRGERLGHMLLVEGSWPRTVLGASGSANCMTSFTTSCRATTSSRHGRCVLPQSVSMLAWKRYFSWWLLEQLYLGVGGVLQS